jgi:hypothetical protein
MVGSKNIVIDNGEQSYFNIGFYVVRILVTSYHVHSHVHTYTDTHTYTHIYVHAHARKQTRTNTHACTSKHYKTYAFH